MNRNVLLAGAAVVAAFFVHSVAHAQCASSTPNPCYNADGTSFVCCPGACGAINSPSATCAGAPSTPTPPPPPPPPPPIPAPPPAPVPPTSAAAARTQFMADAKFGIFLSAFSGFEGTAAYRQRLATFDTEGLAAQLQQMQAGYLVFALEQNDGYLPLYVQRYANLVGPDFMPLPGTSAAPDFMTRLVNSLSARNIKLMFYLASGAPAAPSAACGPTVPETDPRAYILSRLGYIFCPANADEMRQKVFQTHWNSVVREISTRFGSKLAGWYFDGVYQAPTLYNYADGYHLGALATAARAGNPNAAITFNDGNGPLTAVSKHQDFTSGEMRGLLQTPFESTGPMVPLIDAWTGEAYDVRWHMTVTLAASGWNGGYPGVRSGFRFSDDYLVDWLKRLRASGGAVSFDVPMHMGFYLGDPEPSKNGRIADSFVAQLSRVARRLDSTPPTQLSPINVAQGKPTSSNANGGPAGAANDGNVATAWISASDPSIQPKYWQVDLGGSLPATAIEITANAAVRDKGIALYDYFVLGSDDPSFNSFDVLAAQGAGDWWETGGTWRATFDRSNGPAGVWVGPNQSVISPNHRYIRITRPYAATDFENYPAAANRPQTFAEIRVYVPAAGAAALLPPSAPSAVRTTPAFRQVGLRWEPAVGTQVTYTVLRGTQAGAVTTAVGSTSQFSFVDRNVTPGVAYFYQISASNPAGKAVSTAVQAAAHNKAPDAPKDLISPTYGMTGGVPLSWSPVAGEGVRYNVYRGLFDGRPLALLAASIPGTQYLDIAVSPAQWYLYRVTAVNAAGESPFSNDSGALTTCLPPAAPTAQNNGQGVDLTWTPVAGASAYNVYRSSASNRQTSVPYNTQPLSGTRFSDFNAPAGKTYYYRVVALNQNRQPGGWSRETAVVR